MNVKANMLIQKIPELNSMYVMPSASDESLSIGAALHYFYNSKKVFNNINGRMDNLYLGSEIKEYELKKTLLNVKNKTDFTIKENPDFDKVIGDLLNKGEVVAFCRGRAEWGARILGNRSIIAKANSRSIVEKNK